MLIVVNHLTRMEKGYFCVAGTSLRTGRHIRPVMASDRLSTDLLVRHGGPFDIANVIDIGRARSRPTRPHLEDHVFEPSEIKSLRSMKPDEFWNILKNVSETKLEHIFGDELKHIGRLRYGTDKGEGQVSLGCLILRNEPELYLQPATSGRPQIRIRMSDGDIQVNASVTDIRLYADDHITLDSEKVDELSDRIRASESVILSVGLTRPWASSPEFDPVCWLQVNNIHIKEDPCWQLG